MRDTERNGGAETNVPVCLRMITMSNEESAESANAFCFAGVYASYMMYRQNSEQENPLNRCVSYMHIYTEPPLLGHVGHDLMSTLSGSMDPYCSITFSFTVMLFKKNKIKKK